MHISFSNFEAEVEPAVRARGRDSYEAGRVTALEAVSGATSAL